MKYNSGQFKPGHIGPRKGEYTPNEVIKLDGDLLGVVLTLGKITIIKAESYDIVRGYHWFAQKSGNTFYAVSHFLSPDGQVKHIPMHRLLTNAPPDKEVDHKNRDGLLNIPENLRICTKAQNMQNRSLKGDTRSKYKGVTFNRGRWVSRITAGHLIGLGRFKATPKGELAAALAYDAAALVFHGEYAAVNLPGQKIDLDFIRHYRSNAGKNNGKKFEALVAPHFTKQDAARLDLDELENSPLLDHHSAHHSL